MSTSHSRPILARSLLVPLSLLATIAQADTTVPAQTVTNGQTLQVFGHDQVVTSGNVEVLTGGLATFRSASAVKLQPGFKALEGSFFHMSVSLSQSISLSWPSSAGAVRYDIYRNGVKIGESTGTTFTDTTAQGGRSYSYTIKAVAGGGAETTVATLQGASAKPLEVFTPLAQ